MFSVRFGGTEKQLSRGELLREIEAGSIPDDASVSSVEFFGVEGWYQLNQTALWRFCRPSAGSGTALVPVTATSRLGLVPTSVSPEVCTDAGVDEPYMLAMCQAHGITTRQLHHLVGILTCFKSNMAKLHELLDSGLSVEEIEELYDARECLGPESRASLKRLAEFYQTFFEGTRVPGSHLANEIRQAHDVLNPQGFVDGTIRRLCRAAKFLGISDLTAVTREVILRHGAEEEVDEEDGEPVPGPGS